MTSKQCCCARFHRNAKRNHCCACFQRNDEQRLLLRAFSPQ
jgi:hypothetical protein